MTASVQARPALIQQGILVLFLLLVATMFSACVHKVTMRAKDGETLDGRWRYAHEGSALMQVVSGEGEVLVGVLSPIPRRAFFESYETTFGVGAIAAETPDLSAYGYGFWTLPGTTNPLMDVAYAESFDAMITRSVGGPLLYWTAYLEGDRRTSLRCFLIGSNHSSRGLGRCKSPSGKEYTVQF